jgi:hypothetical protein
MSRPRSSWYRPLGLLAALAMALVAGGAPAALANDTPGNNGTVKIHEGAGENDPGEVRNEPHVCTFHLHFFFADPEQAGTWEIQQWAPTGEKGTVVLSGTYDTAGDGEDRQPAEGVYTLPDGHYKLFWDGDLDTDKHDKMKVFWVDCAAASTSPSPAGSEGATAGASSSASASASTSPSASASESASAAASQSSSTGASQSAGSSPTGSELPIENSGAPSFTGEEEGLVGTPPAGVTPPPTDTEPLRTAADDGWRIVLLALAALITVVVMVVQAPVGARPHARRDRRS